MIRFPRTPHLIWLGPGQPRDDKVLSTEDARTFLSGEIVVEEKIDGANVGISVDDGGELVAQNRGTVLSKEDGHPQFKPLFRWLAEHRDRLCRSLGRDLVLFGEWCYALHSVRYQRLPAWLLVFDVYDLHQERFWNTNRRDALAIEIGLATMPILARGRYNLGALRALMGSSRFGEVPAEGLYLRREGPEWLTERAKLVRPEFVQGMGEHWSRRRLETNRLAATRKEALLEGSR